MMSSPKHAVLLLAHGTPDKAEEIPAYLRNVTGGRPVPETVLEEVAHRFSLIGRSPLTDLTLRQAELLQSAVGVPVYVGMRNWRPYIPDVVRQMREAGISRVIAICMAPQNSRTSVGLYKQRTQAEAGAGMEIEFVEEWHDHPELIRGFAERLAPTLKSATEQLAAEHSKTPPAVLFTAHSVPCRTIAAGDPYGRQAKETAELVAARLGIPHEQWCFAFQSQGMSGGTWIGPTVEETITALRQQGRHGIVVQPVGFVCDHVEVLYDIDIAFTRFAEGQGMRLWRAPSLNDSPALIAALADLAGSRLGSFTHHPVSAQA